MPDKNCMYSFDSDEYLSRIPPFITHAFVSLVLIIAIVTSIYLFFGRTNKIISSQFTLVPLGGLKEIQAVRSGTIINILCKVNDIAQIGDVLFHVKSTQVISEISEIAKLQITLQNLEDELHQQMLISSQSLKELTNRLASIEGQLKIKEIELDRIDDELLLKQKILVGEQEIKKLLIRQFEHEYEILKENLKNELARTQNRISDLKVDLKTQSSELILRKKEFENNQMLFDSKEILEKEYVNSKIVFQKIDNDIVKITNEMNMLINEMNSKKEESIRKKNLLQEKISTSKKELHLIELQQKETEMAYEKKKIDLQLSIENLTFEISGLKSIILEKEAEVKSKKLQIESNIKSLKVDFHTLSSTAETNTEKDVYFITAPYEGIITSIDVNTIGSVITVGQKLLCMAPENEPIVAEAYVPNMAIGMLKVHQEVNLKYDAYPYQTFGIQKGTLNFISPDVMDIARLTDPAYRVIINLKAQQLNTPKGVKQLRYGMKGTAEIIISRDRIIAKFIKGLSDLEEVYP